MPDEKIVAYLDLLGMSNRIRSNTEEAIQAYQTYHTILKTKIIDDKIHPPEKYEGKNLKDLAINTSVNSFESFLPFSDSIFISSSNYQSFLQQLSSFLVDCFIYTSQIYEFPECSSDPTLIVDGTKKEHIWPTLFRGGISIGECIPIQVIGILDKKPNEMPCLSGKAVVESVNLEHCIKGPRIIFNEATYKKFPDEVKQYIVNTEKQNIYELLWPGFHYIKTNGRSELKKFSALFTPAVNLWRFYNHTEYSEHYFRFMKLIVQSTKKVFEEESDVAEKTIKKTIKHLDLMEKFEFLYQ